MALDYNVLVSGILGFATATGTWFVATRQQKAEAKQEVTKYSYLDRESIDKEARQLRDEVRQELTRCKEDNIKLSGYMEAVEKEVDALKATVRTLEFELWEWRSGRRKVGDPAPKEEH